MKQGHTQAGRWATLRKTGPLKCRAGTNLPWQIGQRSSPSVGNHGSLGYGESVRFRLDRSSGKISRLGIIFWVALDAGVIVTKNRTKVKGKWEGRL